MAVLPGTHTRRDVIKAGGAAVVGASTLGLFPRLLMPPSAAAAAFTGIRLDPMVDPLLQGYGTQGTQSYTPGPRLAINDNSGSNIRIFFAPAPELVTGPGSVEVDVQIEPASITLLGEETGVEVILNYGGGIGSALRLAFIQRSGRRRVAFKTTSGLSSGAVVDWSAPTKVLIESIEHPNFPGYFDGRLTVDGQTETLGATGMPQATQADPSFMFGCFSGPATARTTFGAIGLPPGPVLVASVQPPINAGGSSRFNATRGVVPLKFSLTSDGSPTCDLRPATLSLSRTGGTSPGPIDESVYTGPSDSGSEFRIADCQYHYNVQASALGPGTYLAQILIDGAVVGEARFELK